MSRFQNVGLALTPLLCSSLLLGTMPSHAYTESLAFETQTVADQPSALDWQTFSFKADGFQVSMPSQPIQYTLPDSQVSAHMYMQMQLTGPNQMEIYGAGVAQVPQPLTDPQEVKQMLAACAKSTSSGNRITQAKKIGIGQHPGIEVEEITAQGRLRVSRCYLVGQRFYTLFTATESMGQTPSLEPTNRREGKPQRTDLMDQFLNSFQVLDVRS